MAQDNEAAWRLWNRCKAQWKSDWRLEYSDQQIVVAAIAQLADELAEAQSELAETKRRMDHFQGLAKELVVELHELDRVLEGWRKSNVNALVV